MWVVITKIITSYYGSCSLQCFFTTFLCLFSHHSPISVSTITTAARTVSDKQILNALVYADASEGMKATNGIKAPVLPRPFSIAAQKFWL